VEWEVLEELTKYHREVTPCMCTRMITPYAHGPSSDELDLIALQCPIDVDDCSLFKEKEGTPTLWKTYLQEINLITIANAQFFLLNVHQFRSGLRSSFLRISRMRSQYNFVQTFQELLEIPICAHL